ncbi:DgyrCDS786 [Dimorphilus gyrociliatus]|uniref:DgyrCDS786 n=1 Tax=Dimorphilus gyrociliatus TaxID=2664684 RepID=A0A7I8V7F4_9ANNE|nr:DgyrCDS786 [Dimorphilus gyrociliatus]
MQANGCENNHDGDDTHVSNGSCNGTSSVPTANSSRKKMSKKDMDIVRLIGQHLRNLGLNRTAEQLIVESGCSLEHPSAAKFRSHVMEGRWDLAETSLSDFKDLVLHEDGLLRMRFLVLEQKYLELLEDSRLLEALNVLRQQLTPLHYCTERVHTLTTYMMCSTAEELRETAKWEGKGSISRQRVMERLHEFLPANVILPPRRLDTLISQAVELQQQRCPYHNSKTTDTDDCLLVDHQCSQEHMPNVTIQLLTDHTDEVWFCRFSPDGNKLATGCKSGQLILWNVDKKRYTVQKWKVLDGHSYGVSTIAWSTDSKYIIVCGPDDCADLWIWNAETGILKTKMNNSPEDSLTTASFYNDTYQFIVAGTRGQFFHCVSIYILLYSSR